MAIIKDYRDWTVGAAKDDLAGEGLGMMIKEGTTQRRPKPPDLPKRIRGNAPGSEPGKRRDVGGIVGVILHPLSTPHP